MNDGPLLEIMADDNYNQHLWKLKNNSFITKKIKMPPTQNSRSITNTWKQKPETFAEIWKDQLTIKAVPDEDLDWQ